MTYPHEECLKRHRTTDVEHHKIILASDLNDYGTNCYISGFDTSKNRIIEELNRVIKDETLRLLVTEKISEMEHCYSYLLR